MNLNPPRLVLRDLPLATRLVLAVFLISVGLGYFSALVQLHFQLASAGSPMPGPQETIDAYHGKEAMCQLQRVLEADESRPFDGSGSMRPAFTTKSTGWKTQIKNKSAQDRQKLLDERDGERLALLAWIQSGSPAKAYEDDQFPLPEKLANHKPTEKYLDEDAQGKPVVKIRKIIEDRCTCCHDPSASSKARQAPLTSYENLSAYCDSEFSSGMSLTKLAQTTHVHLLGFSMLFGLTGLVFSLTSYPGWIRCIFGPWTLVAQLLDISCWWLGRIHPMLAQCIMMTGGLVALGLITQIVGSLFNLFGRKGRAFLLLLFLAGGAAAGLANLHVIQPYLEREKLWPEIRDISGKSLDSNSKPHNGAPAAKP